MRKGYFAPGGQRRVVGVDLARCGRRRPARGRRAPACAGRARRCRTRRGPRRDRSFRKAPATGGADRFPAVARALEELELARRRIPARRDADDELLHAGIERRRRRLRQRENASAAAAANTRLLARILFPILAALKNLSRSLAVVLIIAATFLVYWPALRNGFVWDDTALVLRDPLIRSWVLIPEGFRHFLFLDATASNFYRPIQRLTFVADYAVLRLRRAVGLASHEHR